MRGPCVHGETCVHKTGPGKICTVVLQNTSTAASQRVRERLLSVKAVLGFQEHHRIGFMEVFKPQNKSIFVLESSPSLAQLGDS